MLGARRVCGAIVGILAEPERRLDEGGVGVCVGLEREAATDEHRHVLAERGERRQCS